MSWENWIKKKFSPDDAILSPDAIVFDGAAHRIVSADPPVKEHNTFPVKIVSSHGSFLRAKTENGEIISVELA